MKKRRTKTIDPMYYVVSDQKMKYWPNLHSTFLILSTQKRESLIKNNFPTYSQKNRQSLILF